MGLIIHNISVPNDGLGDALRTGFNNQNLMNAELYATVVFKVTGKDLSSNDFTDALLAKLQALDINAEQNVQADFNELDPTSDAYVKNKPVFVSSAIIVSATWTGSGFVFDVIADQYPVGGVIYNANPAQVTLDASDPTLDRIDLIGVYKPVAPNNIGVIGVIKGTPASPALVVPPDYDPSEFYVIKQVTVKAASTNPDGFSNTLVFDEGVEWATTLTSNLSITENDPYTGVKSIEAVNNTALDKVTFNAPSVMSTADLDLITFYLKLKEEVLGKYIRLEFYLGSVRVAEYFFKDPENLFNETNLSYQKISIDKSQLNFPITDFDKIVIQPLWDSTGYFIDNVQVYSGSGSETDPANGIPDAPMDSKLYGRINGAWSEIKHKEYIVEGYPFTWKKGRSNLGILNADNNIMEQNDLILFGFCDVDGSNTLVKLAQYNTGDPSLITSYNIIESI